MSFSRTERPRFSRIAQAAAAYATFADDLSFRRDWVTVLAMRGGMRERGGTVLSILDSVVSGFKMVSRDDLCETLVLAGAQADQLVGNAIEFRQFDCRPRNTILIEDFPRASSIQQLLSPRSPFAVLRTIADCVVDPLQRVLGRWLWAHIGNEVFEPLLASPAVANRNSAASIIVVMSALQIVAALKHIAVGSSEWMRTHMFSPIDQAAC